MKVLLLSMPVVLGLSETGCSISEAIHTISTGPSREVGHSASAVDDEAKAYYEEQIMDNLVRAANGQPFVQTDLSNLGAVIEWRLTANVQGGRTGADTSTSQATRQTVTQAPGETSTLQSVTSTPFATVAAPAFASHSTTSTLGSALQKTVTGTAGLVTSVASTVTRPISGSFTPEHDNTLTMNASPVVQDPNIANFYVRYLNLSGGPGKKPRSPRFVTTDFKGNANALVKQLIGQNDPLSKFLWKRFGEGGQKALTDADQEYENSKSDPKTKAKVEMKNANVLVQVFNPIIQGPSIYTRKHFEGVTLDEYTFGLLAKQTPTSDGDNGAVGPAILLLNRQLLSAYYAGKIVTLSAAQVTKEDPGDDFDYAIDTPDNVKTLEKRKLGFDHDDSFWPKSIQFVDGTMSDLRKSKKEFVPGAVLTVYLDSYGRMRRVDKNAMFNLPHAGVRTYYIPKGYGDAFFHLCMAVVSRVPSKAGGAQSSKAQPPTVSLPL